MQKILSEGSSPQPIVSEPSLKMKSADRFGYEWASHGKVIPEHREQLQRWLGPISIESFRSKTVLDVGCGMGRNSFWIAKAGAAGVLCIDVDPDALAAARKNLTQFPNVKVEERSVYNLSPESVGTTFDRVFCIGVLHHLENPALALEKMWSMVAPGGELVVWCYGKEGNRKLLPFIQVMRAVGSRLPLSVAHVLATVVTITAWPVIKLAPWRTGYYRKLKSLSFKNVQNIIFDQMIPRIAHYWTGNEMSALVKPLGGTSYVTVVQGNSWNVVVKK